MGIFIGTLFGTLFGPLFWNTFLKTYKWMGMDGWDGMETSERLSAKSTGGANNCTPNLLENINILSAVQERKQKQF